MDNSTVGVTSALNPQQPLKVDDKQNLSTSPLVVNSVDSSAQGSGAALNYVVQETVDKWAGKTATNYIAPIDSATTASSAAKGSTVSLLNPIVANTQKYYAPLAATIAAATAKPPANIVPQGLTISGVKPSYDNSSNLSIDSGSISDGNGWKDLTKVDFWLIDAKGVRVELADATSFLAKDTNTATFSYTTSLKGIANGDYKLNAVAYDKFGSQSNQFTQSMTIKPVNIAPQALIINGIKSSYTVNSVLSIDPSFVSDNNGWQDLNKVDFWLTNDRSQRIELADVNSFTVNSTNSANFSYTTSLSGIAVGNYKINAIAYDRSGTASNLFTQSLTINPVYTLGFDGTKINTAFISTFNQVNGTQILGKAIDNVRSITGGTVQNFERGSIFQSAIGTFALQGTLNTFYNNLSAADKLRLGMPTANETSAGGYWHQSFQNGELQLVQGVPVKWSNQTLISDRYNLLGGANALGKSIGIIRDLNGSAVQDYEKGSIFASGNKTIAVTGAIATYYRANSASLGLPVSEEIITSYGKFQDFSNGKTLINSTQFGTQVLQGSLGGYYRGLSEAQRNQLGAPYTGENDLGGGNWRQFFKGGTVEWKNNGTGEIKLTPFTIGFDGTVVNTAFTNEFNKVVGWEALGKATSNVRNINGGTVQDFEKGSIFKSGAGTFAVRGSIGIYYRANSATLLLPTSAEVATSYGWRQDFQGAVVTHSPQFGTHTIRGSVGGYYNGLTAAQKDQLGAATTQEAVGGDGNWQQFFKGGSVLWKSNGTGELKLTPFTVGFDGNSVNAAFTTKFNQVVGWELLGKTIDNVLDYKGSKIQDFENGSIIQSGSSTFVLSGRVGDYIRNRIATLGLPTSEAIVTSYGLRQECQDATVTYSNPFGVHTIHGNIGTYYRRLTTAQQDQLGAATTEEAIGGDGNLQQFFKGGSVLWKSNGTGELKLTPFTVGFNGSNVNPAFTTKFNQLVGWDTLGKATGNVRAITDGSIQDFEKGTIVQIKSQTFSLTGGIATYYKGLNAAQLQELGAPISDARDSNGTVVQDFQNGSIYKTSTGTFSTRGEIGKYDVDRSMPGVPLGEAVTTSYGSRQDFSEGTVIYSAKAGIRLIEGNLGKYYQSLTEAEKTRLGFTYNNQWYYGTESTFRFFQGGVLEVKSNGSKQVRFTAGAIGFDGTNFNDKFIEKFMGTDAFNGLGDPTSNIYSANGVLRQDFQKGYITQNGLTMESLFWPTNLGLLGRDYLNTTGKASASLPVIYNFTVDKQTNTSAKLYGIQGDAKFSLFNSQNQLIANDTLNSGTRFIQSSLAPGTYTLKVTSDSVGDFTLSVTPIVTILVNNPPPPATGGSVIVIDARSPSLPDNAWKAEYYNNSDLQGNSTFTRQEEKINNEWGEGGPGNGVGNDNFSVRWQGNFYFDGGNYAFRNTVDDGMRIVVDDEVIHDTWNGRNALGFAQNKSLSQGWHKVKVEYREMGGLATAQVWWDRLSVGNNNTSSGSPVGFDGNSAHNTYINTFNRLGGSGAVGSATNNVHHWGNGYTQDFQGGAEGHGAIMKSDANDNSYWVGGSFWNAYLATGNGADGALGYPTSDRIGNRQNFQNGALINGSNGIFAVYGGIGGHYLNNEGGENGRLGAPTSGEQGIGNGKIVQHFQNGDILYGSGATSTLLTAGGAVNYKEFAGVVRSDVGIKLRQGPTTGYNYDRISPYNQVLQFDAWTTGESIPDPSRNNAPDNRWFHVVGTNNWVASAYIYGEPNNSINTPFVQQPTPTNTGEPPINGGSSPPSGTSRSFNSSFFREGNIFWLQGFAPASTSPSFTNLGNAKGNCTWYVNGRLQELGYSTATLNKLSGNAQDWDNQAIAAGITISSTPKVGSIAQWENGHVAVVERVNADGTILISESSYSSISGSALDYLYNTRTISASNPTRFIIVPLSGSSTVISNPTPAPTTPKDGKGFVEWYSERYPVELRRIDGGTDIADRPTWIVSHGWTGKPTDKTITELANAIDRYQEGDQVLFLDWSEPAKGDLTSAASWIPDVAKFAVEKLKEWKIKSTNINLVGHSLGTFVSYEIAKGMGGVSKLIALDPATEVGVGLASIALAGITGGYNPYGVDFNKYATWSWGFYGSFAGSSILTETAKESFQFDFDGFDASRHHGAVVEVFTKILNNNRSKSGNNIGRLGAISSLFNIDNMRSYSGKLWNNDHPGFEAKITMKQNGDAFSPDYLKVIGKSVTLREDYILPF
jgi:uncharacterized protein with LGFP repeats/pimeloyl-ACP methyl ester carboxylesterase